MEDKLYWMGWQYLIPGAPSRMWGLLRLFGDARSAWHASRQELSRVTGLKGRALEQLLERRAGLDLDGEMENLQQKGIDFICYHDINYPRILRDIYDPPPGLFVRGNMRQVEPSAALVGSRRATAQGTKIAGRLAGDLARAGVTVISGMARGVDTAAHRGALEHDGYTVAVLGCGLDVVYPRENEKLMQEIAARGVLVSEFPPGSAPEPWHFPVRNRVISGLSRIVVVVEAGEKSGALITADQALEQGRDVAAVPGNVLNPMSKGPNGLIKQGARLVENAADVMEEAGWSLLFPPREVSRCSTEANLTGEEQKIIEVLSGGEPLHLDGIISAAGCKPENALSLLMYLEIKGLVKQLPGKMFVRTG